MNQANHANDDALTKSLPPADYDGHGQGQSPFFPWDRFLSDLPRTRLALFWMGQAIAPVEKFSSFEVSSGTRSRVVLVIRLLGTNPDVSG